MKVRSVDYVLHVNNHTYLGYVEMGLLVSSLLVVEVMVILGLLGFASQIRKERNHKTEWSTLLTCWWRNCSMTARQARDSASLLLARMLCAMLVSVKTGTGGLMECATTWTLNTGELLGYQ